MVELRVILEGDAGVADLKNERWAGRHNSDKDNLVPLGQIERVLVLPRGMTSGLPSVTAVLKLPDGSYAMGETSARAFVRAAEAIRARYPEIDAS